MGEFITYKTSSPSGDLISYLAGIRQIWLDKGKKGIIYHRLNMIGGSYEGAIHPYFDADQNPICFNEYAFGMMCPLLKSQPYIEDYLVFDGQEFEIDLDKTRLEIFTNQPKGSLNRWMNHPFPQMATNLANVWIEIPKGIVNNCEDKIIINYTQRHRNTYLHYFFLKKYQDKIIFAGLQNERDLFCAEWGLDIPLLQVDNFYDLARIISGCKFFMGNQSFCFQIAESQKIPRILELFPMMPNVIPIGDYAYDVYHQGELEFHFKQLYER